MRKTFTFSSHSPRMSQLPRRLIRSLFGADIAPNHAYQVRIDYAGNGEPATVQVESAPIDPQQWLATTVAEPAQSELAAAMSPSAEQPTEPTIETLPLDVFDREETEDAEASAAAPAAAPARRCQWCSTALHDDARSCPACGSQAIVGAEVSIPGLTELHPSDAAALARPLRSRSRMQKEMHPAELVGEIIRHALDDV